jgi:hypothetical protein
MVWRAPDVAVARGLGDAWGRAPGPVWRWGAAKERQGGWRRRGCLPGARERRDGSAERWGGGDRREHQGVKVSQLFRGKGLPGRS